MGVRYVESQTSLQQMQPWENFGIYFILFGIFFRSSVMDVLFGLIELKEGRGKYILVHSSI